MMTFLGIILAVAVGQWVAIRWAERRDEEVRERRQRLKELRARPSMWQ